MRKLSIRGLTPRTDLPRSEQLEQKVGGFHVLDETSVYL